MPLSQHLSRSAWSVLLDQALDGLRQGGIPPWPHDRWPSLKRRFEQQWLGPIWGTWGDQITHYERWPAAVQLLLHWAFGLIRPDHQTTLGLTNIPENAWVDQTTWRPLLAVAATSGLLAVPTLPGQYRRSSGESALDTLCGLWAVGSSTTYRYVDKGKRQLLEALCVSHRSAFQRWALRDFAAKTRTAAMSSSWHTEQAQILAQHGHAMDAAWHLCQAQIWSPLAELLRRKALELASDPEHIALSQSLRRATADARSRVELALGESVIWRCLGKVESELDCLQLAIRTAPSIQDNFRTLHSGLALHAMGYFYNARDPEQAISHFEAAVQQLNVAARVVPDRLQHLVQSAYVNAIASLAFVHLRRNNPQGQTLLQSALAAARECEQLDAEANGMLLKAQAEEARCRDQVVDAIRYRQRALVLYERMADTREVVEQQVNLGQLLAHSGSAEEAKHFCSRVISMAQRFCIRPEALLSAHGGMAVAAMTQKEFASAIEHLHEVLRISQQFGMQRHHLGGLMNLAEVHYLRFKEDLNSEDERLGDHYVEQCGLLSGRLGLPQSESKARSLKQATLNPQTAVHHLLPIENSAHPGEFAKIEALRAELALPRPPAQRARTHIALSQLYLRIAAKERDAARGLMQTHGLSELEGDIEALQQTWAHDGNLASQLSSRWREQVGDWLTDSQRKAVLERLLAEGSLSKSSYGEAAEVSPATASKHLGLLADKGLLEQQGRGPATRYVLPGEASSGSPSSLKVH